jgi:hypothetical protein
LRYQRDIHRPQAALGALDVEADSLAFVEKNDLGRLIGAMDEYVAAAVIANNEAKAFGFIKELYAPSGAFAGSVRCHDGRPVSFQKLGKAQKAARRGAGGLYVRSSELSGSAAGAVLQNPHARDEMRPKSGAVKRGHPMSSLFR